MGDKTGIEWTDATWNPLIGCSLKSDGCKNCYAMKVAHRFQGTHNHYKGTTKLTSFGPHWTGVVNQSPLAILNQPLRWTRPRMIFVNSMSDLFHESVDFEYIAACFGVMAAASQHKFQVLTKRPERAVEFFAWLKETYSSVALDEANFCARMAMKYGVEPGLLGMVASDEATSLFEGWPLKNVWMGTSIENQKAAEDRMLSLIKIPAAVRWISAEPLLGPVDFGFMGTLPNSITGSSYQLMHQHIDWMVVGGESGPGARPMAPSWARSILRQCKEADIPYLFKQWGDWGPHDDGSVTVVGGDGEEFTVRLPLAMESQEKKPIVVKPKGGGRSRTFRAVDGWWMEKLGKKVAGRELDGSLYDGYPS
jgi:protein gp37